MTLAIGNVGRRSAGFTLVELLLTLALMGLLAGLCIGAAAPLFGGRGERGAEVFWTAVGEAQRQAVERNATLRLTCAEDGKLRVGGTGFLREFTLPEKNTLQSDGAGPVAVAFYADGTCDAFRGKLIQPSRPPLALGIDPWTGAAVLPGEWEVAP